MTILELDPNDVLHEKHVGDRGLFFIEEGVMVGPPEEISGALIGFNFSRDTAFLTFLAHRNKLRSYNKPSRKRNIFTEIWFCALCKRDEWLEWL